jgi:hypothetical protein
MEGLKNFRLQQVERKNCLGDTRGFVKVFEKEYSNNIKIMAFSQSLLLTLQEE